MKRTIFLFLLLLVVAAVGIAGDGKRRRADVMLSDAPAKVNALRNPYEGRSDAMQAGAKLFARHCAKCHGSDAAGDADAPSLRGPLVENATPGALFWFLKNGSIRSGMPSWAGLPEQQRWQLVTYLKSLPKTEEAKPQ